MRLQDSIFLPAGICLSASAIPLKKLLAARAVLCLRDACRGVCSLCWFCSAEKVESLIFVNKIKSYDLRSKTGAE